MLRRPRSGSCCADWQTIRGVTNPEAECADCAFAGCFGRRLDRRSSLATKADEQERQQRGGPHDADGDNRLPSVRCRLRSVHFPVKSIWYRFFLSKAVPARFESAGFPKG